MPFNSLGLILDPLLLYQYNWAEEVGGHAIALFTSCLNVIRQAPPVPSAPRIGTIDLPEVDISQGYDGLEANNNSLPAEQQVHEVEGQAVPAGQPLPPTQGGINLDEGFALQEEPFIAPEAYAENIETGYFLVNEPAAYDDEGGLEEGLLIAHPVLEPVDFDPFMSVGDDDEAMEI
jgi:hypothetical protein